MAGFNVAPDRLAEANAAYDKGWEHFGGLAKTLGQYANNLRALRAFEGGHGIEGHYQARLAKFGDAWLEMLDKFVVDEHKFAAFLGGFEVRLKDTSALYQELESRVGKLFDDIGNTIDGGR